MREPGESKPAASLPWKEYHPFSLNALSEKKCRNTASDGVPTPAKWQITTNPAMARHPLGASWLGAAPKWESTSPNNGCNGTRIPASSECAYTQTAPGGGGEHARRSPAGSGANSSGTRRFLHRASRDSWVRKEEARRSATGLVSASPPLVPSSSVSAGRRAEESPMM
jgi:hypothetical protein